jgi:hypothetical protein
VGWRWRLREFGDGALACTAAKADNLNRAVERGN